MSNYQRGLNPPNFADLPYAPRPLPYVRHLPSPEKEFAPYIDPQPVEQTNTPGAAYTLTCDSGHCDRRTVAVVLGVEGAWLSMCKEHTAEELIVL